MKKGDYLKGKVRRARWRLAHARKHGASKARVAQARKTAMYWAGKLAAFRRQLANNRASASLWGGSRAVTNEVIRIVDGRARVGSRKRWELFGNRASDHYRGNLNADAIDFLIAEAHWLKNEISRRLGGPMSLPDYGSFYVKRRGKVYRVQIIAGTHGTGPHLHVGVRRA